MFIDAPEPALALIRRVGSEGVLCALNLGAEAVHIALPAGLRVAPLSGHGLSGRLEGDGLSLPGYGGFFGNVE